MNWVRLIPDICDPSIVDEYIKTTDAVSLPLAFGLFGRRAGWLARAPDPRCGTSWRFPSPQGRRKNHRRYARYCPEL